MGPARIPALDADSAARLTAAGWVEAGAIVPDAEAFLDELRGGPDPEGAAVRVATIVGADPALGREALADPTLGAALVALAGISPALARIAALRPDALRRACVGSLPVGPLDLPAGDRRARMGALRDAVADRLLAVAAGDLTGRLTMPEAGSALSEVADAAAAAALQIAAADPELPFAIVAMGKWGGRELNYASDVDVLFVYAVPAGADPDIAARAARQTAESFLDALGTPVGHGVPYRVDAGLRPEGAAGPLARTLESYRSYWERWAETWELQALIKARFVAGDPALGTAFIEAAAPFVYPETLGADAVREVRSLKALAEDLAERRSTIEIKRGVGGIRDAEFSVQLLQLVHGRSDPGLRSANTLEALAALGDSGYVRPDDAADLERAYRWLRDVEHRLQLVELRQTHELPESREERDRIARSMGFRDIPQATALERFDAHLVECRATIRTIHERLFYRPLLEAFAASPAIRLTPEGAARQLAALGFLDLEGARTAFADLTAGLSRRSRLMQQLLPLMMDWLSESPDPDLGLSQLRLLVTTTPDNAQLIAAMRDNPVAAERLCTLLGTSRLLGRLVDRIPPAMTRLGDDTRLSSFPSPDDLHDEASRRLLLHPPPQEAATALGRFVDTHLFWVASQDLIGVADEEVVGRRLSDVADAAVHAALDAAIGAARDAGDHPPPMAVLALGKWGGRELNFASDLDGLVVFDGADTGEAAAATAHRIAGMLVTILSAPPGTGGPGLAIDLDLRPEGRTGPPARSVASYRSYWERWADTWETQALLRARPAAGDAALGATLARLAADHVRGTAFGPDEERAVRQMKVRIEQERIPPDEDSTYHMKLGRGGMSDVEWVVQLLQMRHGGAEPGILLPGTLPALQALAGAGLISADDAAVLDDAYRFCARVRNRLFLQAGRPRDSLPTDPVEVTRLARSLGHTRHPRAALREDYRRVTRRARRVFESIFFANPGSTTAHGMPPPPEGT